MGNRSNSPSYKAIVKESAGNIVVKQDSPETHYHINQTRRPRLQIVKGPSHSGGSGGFFFTFTIKNVGERSALNIGWGYEADDLSSHHVGNLTQSLAEQEEYQINPPCEYSQSELFKKLLKNPRIVLFFHDPDDVDMTNEINIGQEKRADGNYNIKPVTNVVK